MTSGRKGRANEARTERWLHARGMSTIRAAASRGVFDVIGFGNGQCVLVQVKTNRNAGPAERERIAAVVVPEGCHKCVHIWRKYARAPEVITL